MIIKKIRNFKFVIRNCQAGMSYVELIVVLSIFSVMTSIILFNYGEFQGKVDIKNLASDIALKIVEAQKLSLSGAMPASIDSLLIPDDWKPSYGLFLDAVDSKNSFMYFVDINNNTYFEYEDCYGECLEKVTITKNNIIDKLEVFGVGCSPINALTITFKRPDSGAIMVSSPPLTCVVSYAQITIKSPQGATAKIKVFLSGRIEIN